MFSPHLLSIRVHRNLIHLALSCLVGFSVFVLYTSFVPPLVKAQASVEEQSSAPTSFPSASPLCASVNTIPGTECDALVALYQSTDGAHWLDNTNWLTVNTTISPCDWHGVLCNAGSVVQLMLTGNRLRGPFPRSLSALTHLSQLLLADNQLAGRMPLAVCDWVKYIQVASFDHNQLTVDNRRVKACLDTLDPNWATTQNVPPINLRVSEITTDSLRLNWTPILYTGDGGYYEISTSPSITGTFTVHGHTADKNANSYLLDNLMPGQLYQIRIRTYTPVPNGNPSDGLSEHNRTFAVTQATTGKVLVIAYFPADNDLSSYTASILRRFQVGTELNPNVQVVFLADQQGDHNTTLFEIDHGVITPTHTIQAQWGKDELDTMDPQVLAWFLKYARNQYPASRTVVALMGHGAGLTPEVFDLPTGTSDGNASPSSGIPALPQGVERTPGDITSQSGYLSTIGIAQALATATDNGAHPFDVVFFDQCFQGNLDVLYEVRNSGRVFIASPNYGWLVAAYQKYLLEFTPTATPEALADAIIHLYQASLTNQEPNVIFWVRSADITAVESAVSQLGTVLQLATQGGQDNQIWAAARNSQYVDTTQCGRGNTKLGPPDELLGAGSLAHNLQLAFPVGDPFGVYNAAGNVLAALANVHSLARTGRPYIAPETFWDYTDTFTLLAPLRRDMTQREMLTGKIWRASIYTSPAPINAVWAPTPTLSLPITANFASTQDSQWDEFITHWYTNPLTPTLGEWCHYMPPPLVTSDVTETLTLTVTPNGNTVQLHWSETANDAANAYWILARKTDKRNWIVLASVPLTQTSYIVLQPPAGGSYQLSVVAEDEAGLVLAEANAAAYTAPIPEVDQRIYLPYVQR